MRKRVDVIEVKRRLDKAHQGIVSIVEDSFINANVKATFVDVEFGTWQGRVSHVCNGSSHPVRGKLKQAASYKRSFKDLNVLEKRKATNLIRHGVEHPAQSKKIYDKVKATNLIRYGSECCMNNKDVFIKNKRSQKITYEKNHWKTGERLVCTSSWEAAFVNWCNYNKIDFDWQIPIMMGNGSTYFIDAFIKDGEFANTWIEIKGFWYRSSEIVSRAKWEEFHATHKNSELWQQEKLNSLGILVGKKPNFRFDGVV